MPGTSGSAHVDGLVGAIVEGVIYNYSWLNYSFDNNITYAFADVDGYGWTTEQMNAWQGAAQQWANVANINFTEVPVAGSPRLLESWVDGTTMNDLTGNTWTGYHQFPDATPPANGYFNIERSILQSGNLDQGGFGFRLVMHEIGHSLGLFHPHGAIKFPGVSASSDLGDNDLNQNLYSLMSYNAGILQPTATNTYGLVGTPMALDIAAIQFLYGANMSYMTGNDVYNLPDANASGTYWSAIWDAGGTDAISYAGTRDAVINLNTATLLNAPGGGGFLSYAVGIAGGFTIAKDAVIENANGGSGNDIITGNDVANIINGAAGTDLMTGGGGNDTYAVDNSYDQVIEQPGGGEDAVYSSVDLLLAGNVETLILTGAAIQGFGDTSNNQIFGNGAINVLFGQGGDDYLLGLGGDDIFVITPEAGAFDVVGDFQGAGVAGGDRVGIAGFGPGAQVYQVSQTSFEIRSADNSIIQQFVLQGHDGTALNADDYYFA